ncbi:MAG TPA: hypothetical protein VKE22_29940 [Haliangiales bacterium]|nr:hypothetical protein [Haliangiales bacterium]
MRRLILVLPLLLLPCLARAQDHPFGFGLVLGAPTGLSAKLYLSRPMALQFGLGWEPCCRYYRGLDVNVDVLWHPAIITRQPSFVMPFYLGVGARFLDHTNAPYPYNDHVHVGVRVPFGILMDFPQIQLDVFLELAVVVDIIYTGSYPDDHDRADINGGIGVRYYF